MVKGKTNIFYGGLLFLPLIFFNPLMAQVEVIQPDEEEKETEEYYDSIPANFTLNVQERTIPDSLVKQLQQDEAFWYANAKPAQKKPATQNDSFSFQWLRQGWVRVLLWIVILGSFVAVLVWYLSTLNIRLFRKPSAAISTLPDAHFSEDIFTLDFDTQISRAIQNKNYRQAVRFYYLKTLRLLSDNNLIRYKQDMTNSEYVNQLYQTPYYNHFFRLTRNFEYTWYGGFDIAPAAFEAMQKDFKTFYNGLSS